MDFRGDFTLSKYPCTLEQTYKLIRVCLWEIWILLVEIGEEQEQFGPQHPGKTAPTFNEFTKTYFKESKLSY